MPERASPMAAGRPKPKAIQNPAMAPGFIRTDLQVSLEAGLEPLRNIRAGEKLRLWLEPSGAEGLSDVAVERADGTPVGYLEPAIGRRISPALERSRREFWATVVAIEPGPGHFSEPRIAVEFRPPDDSPGGAPLPAAAVPPPDGLVPTAGYPHPYPFPYFNPVQSAVYPLRGEANNLVVSASTSAGKTIAAELVMDDTLARGLKAIYLSPFKALTEERFADWSRRYAGRGLVIMTGDYLMTPELQARLAAAQIVVMTSEMMDSRTRKFDSERNEWMRAVGLVVVDEAHILSTPRGDKVETGLMRFARFCPQARIMLLSATVSNYEEIGRWLTVLNGKRTDIVHSDWRPVSLNVSFVEHRENRFPNGMLDYHQTEQEKLALATALILEKPEEKFLVFVHTKRTGFRLLDALRQHAVSARFHNGDLEPSQRAAIEASFKDRTNGIRVLVSTSTTAWGVNLPARNVIVLGVMRGLAPVDPLDIIQMAGRAGRYGIDDEGHVFLIVPRGQVPRWREAFHRPRPVTSMLNDHDRLCEHITAELYTGAVRSLGDVFDWHRRSLAHLQGRTLSAEEDVRRVLTRLTSLGMIRREEEALALTPLGAVAAVMYFPPADIHAWCQAFGRLFEKDLSASLPAAAWAIAAAPSFALDYLPAEFGPLADREAASLATLSLRLPRTHLPFFLGVRACLCHERPLPGSHAYARRFRVDASRILAALRLIDQTSAHWGRGDYWDFLEAAATRSPKSHA
jgi:superfamily II DNA/RNA helicase